MEPVHAGRRRFFGPNCLRAAKNRSETHMWPVGRIVRIPDVVSKSKLKLAILGILGIPDVGAYLTTPTFKGVYDGIKEHEPDLGGVLARAWRRGVEKILIPSINSSVSREALHIAQGDDRIFCTVGCSPARSHEFNKEGSDDYLASLADLVQSNPTKVLAYGEIGLDYRWLEIADKDTQQKYFEMQLDLASTLNLPVYVNTRNSVKDVLSILKKFQGKINRGIIHSFDGTQSEAEEFLSHGFYIGVNGCSMRTDENLMMIKALPLERLVLESNAPWCLLKPLHAGYRFVRTTYPARAKFHWSPDSMVRGRNEPANINQVLEVVSAVKDQDPESVCDIIYKNTHDLFFDQQSSGPSPDGPSPDGPSPDGIEA